MDATTPPLSRRRRIKKFLVKQKYRWLYRLGEWKKKVIRNLAFPLRWMPGGPDAGICYLTGRKPFTPELVVMGYCQGMFPMGTPSGKIVWDGPQTRAVLKLDQLHISRRLNDYVRKGQFEIRFDTAFDRVIRECASREDTWITPRIIELYSELHRRGIVHCVEAWQGDELVGGGYGIGINSFFALESMFFRVNQASKVAFIHLCQRLREGGFLFMDLQFLSDLWASFGTVEMPRAEYNRLLVEALLKPAHLDPTPIPAKVSAKTAVPTPDDGAGE